MYKLKDWVHINDLNRDGLSLNPNAIYLLEQNPDKIYLSNLSSNPSIFELDYVFLKNRCNLYLEELIKKTCHPSRIIKLLDQGIEIEDLDNYF